jgi:asparagine synthase (glutamine-hydrolysing)
MARSTDVRLYVAGKPGCHDIAAARSAAQALALPLREVPIGVETIGGAVERISSSIVSPSPIEIAVSVPLDFVSSAAAESAIATGTGADELFGGYARYFKMAPGEMVKMMHADYAALKRRGAVNERSIAAAHGKVVIQPFMDEAVEAIASSIEPEHHVWMGSRKALLRSSALACGLPGELIRREKKAAQYGSGVARMLQKEYIGRQNRDLRKGY